MAQSPQASAWKPSEAAGATRSLFVMVCLVMSCGDGIGQPIQSLASTVGGNSDRTSVAASVGGDDSNASGGVAGAMSTQASPSIAGSASSSVGSSDPTAGATDSAPARPPPPPPPPTSEGGAPAFCYDTERWPPELAAIELSMFDELNRVRQSGFTCPGAAPAGSVQALEMSIELRCSARLKSLDNFTREGVATRIVLAGFPADQVAEVVALSPPTNIDIRLVLRSILDRGGFDCSNMIDARFSAVGIGFAVDATQGYWTIDLASP